MGKRAIIPSFASRRKAWSSPPVDDIGYFPSEELLKLSDDNLAQLVFEMETNRYLGWRNYEGRWRDVLGLDTTHEKLVLDYGCGVGIEALQYAKAGNTVVVADICEENVVLAMRVLRLHGYESAGFIIEEHALVSNLFRYDVIHCAGVLHHIPEPGPVVIAMRNNMSDKGELRLMLYSDEAWRIATGSEPPAGYVEDDPHFKSYWQHWDPHGGYADWYDRDRLQKRFGAWFDVVRYEPLTDNGAYVGAVLVKR